MLRSQTPISRFALEIDHVLLRLSHVRTQLVVPLAFALEVLVRRRAWIFFGDARLEDFARERLGRSARWARDLAALHRAIVRHPMLARALCGEDGEPPLGRVAALLIGRVAQSDDLEAWIDRARALSVRELQTAVRQARRNGTTEASEGPPQEPQGGAEPQGADGHDHESDGEGNGALDAKRNGEFASNKGEGLLAENERAAEVHETDSFVPIQFSMPASVRVAFDEAAELHKAVCGREQSRASFVEALTAEILSEAEPALTDRVLGRSLGNTSARRSSDVTRASPAESATTPLPAGSTQMCGTKATATDARLRFLQLQRDSSSLGPIPGTTAMRKALRTLARYEQTRQHISHSSLEQGEERRSASNSAVKKLQELVRAVQDLIRIEDEIEMRLGELLVELNEKRCWHALHFEGVEHYAEERLGMSRTAARDRLTLAHRLRSLPHVQQAYESGELGIEAALLTQRVLAPGRSGMSGEWGRNVDQLTQQAWVAHVSCVTLKRLRDEVCELKQSRLQRAMADGREGPPAANRREWARPDVHPDVAPLQDDRWLASRSRAAGQSRERVLDLGHQLLSKLISGRSIPDVFLQLRLPPQILRNLMLCLESRRGALRNQVEQVQSMAACDEARLSPAQRMARYFVERRRRIPEWLALWDMLEAAVCTWDDPGGMPRRRADAVYIRDGWRCTAPGCTSRRNLEEHHIEYRSRGGGHGLENRTCVCRFHHQQGEHGGLAACRGHAPGGVVWRLGRIEVASWYQNERRLAMTT